MKLSWKETKRAIILLIIAISLISFSAFSQNSYVATSDLNLRAGAGTSYAPLAVILKGDTVIMLGDTSRYWVKIQYQDKIGYSSKEYLQKVQLKEDLGQDIVLEQSESNSFSAIVITLAVLIFIVLVLTQIGKGHRNISFAKFLSFFFGTFGFQKYYLGQSSNGTLSIMFCWTFVPTIVGIIDFVKLASMSEENFNMKYNGVISNPKKSKKTPPKAAKSKAAKIINVEKKKSQNEAKEYAVSLYKEGLYIEEILTELVKAGYKMPNGDEIINFSQVKFLVRRILPNATFEAKPKELDKTSKKNSKTSVEKTYRKIESAAKKNHSSSSSTKEVSVTQNIDSDLRRLAEKEYPDSIAMQEFTYKRQVEAKLFLEKVTDEEIKEFVKNENPNDYSVQKYNYEQQIEAKAFMAKASDEEVKQFVLNENPKDYALQRYNYEQQIGAKAFMAKVSDKEAKEYALRANPSDYSLQKYNYEQQVDAKAFMAKASDKEIKEHVETEYPKDYEMQKYLYEEQIVLPPRERQTVNRSNEEIIDVNSEEFDLNIEHAMQSPGNTLEPPYWGHTYVYSYDELNYASKAQKEFYHFFREKVLNGEFVDIKGYTNYAFILYFDVLNEYDKHHDIKLLEEQFKLIGEICPKTKRYSLMSLQDLLRKRTDSYSVDKLDNLQDPSYQFEHGYSDYDPDAYKLGKQYKEKLGLNKQEVAWLNKFWNPANVFISIEGCCIATIKQYLLVIRNLNRVLKPKDTSIAKETNYFKEKLFDNKEIADSYWGYYDNSYMKQKVESEIYLAIFKRVENSVREFYGHKRKVGSNPYYEFEGEFESRIGIYVDELVVKYQGEIILPDIETQIELNSQNVNRWKNEFNELKNSYQNTNKSKFIDGILTLEETNQKNPNIENIFFEASKFISKYDKVQSLRYYAKYIYYDLKSKKIDNKQLTKTVQKSLFKSEEQIDTFKRIISELVNTSDIKKALTEIDNIYIPKRKKIKLDKTEIEEVEQKHDGTVKLLNEYLDDGADELESENGEVEVIEIISPNNNGSSILISDIQINKTQEELILKIVSNSFEIHQDEVEKFATENGVFKNQLIDSINEACEIRLDGEALIEEEDEKYIIEESYYKEIAI
nr:SH3 domain-containing protein [uncultured Draconibacterium sp.]